jgi:uncharacterized membrane protein
MQKNHRLFFGSAVILILLAAVLIFIFIPYLEKSNINSTSTRTAKQAYTIGFGSDTVRGKVLDILEEGTVTLGDTTQPYQILLIKLQEGPSIGQLLEIDYGLRQLRPAGLNLQPGDEILVTVGKSQDGALTAYFTDYIRSRGLLWLLGTFIVFILLISGFKGVRSLLGMLISLAVIIGFIIPNILQGKDPVLISVSGAFVILAITLYLVYGWTLKTHAAVIGTLISLIITGFMADYFVNLTRLTGFGSEDALFLIQKSEVRINLQGLVFGGMLIGALGVLDDLVITQASAVFELHQAGEHRNWLALYRSAMRIGQDHVAATVNTLVLAYAGAALPTLLLFSLSGEQYSYLVNLEFVAEEIVRTLVGSLGLIAAVPITTALGSFLAANHTQLGRLESWLGPINSENGHSHTH